MGTIDLSSAGSGRLRLRSVLGWTAEGSWTRSLWSSSGAVRKAKEGSQWSIKEDRRWSLEVCLVIGGKLCPSLTDSEALSGVGEAEGCPSLTVSEALSGVGEAEGVGGLATVSEAFGGELCCLRSCVGCAAAVLELEEVFWLSWIYWSIEDRHSASLGCLGLGDAFPESEAASAALQAVEVMVVDEGLQSDQVTEVDEGLPDEGLHSDQEVADKGLHSDQVLEAFLVVKGLLLELVETEVMLETALKVLELEEVASEEDLARNLTWK